MIFLFLSQRWRLAGYPLFTRSFSVVVGWFSAYFSVTIRPVTELRWIVTVFLLIVLSSC